MAAGRAPVVVVGAGLAGLVAAWRLTQAHVPVRVLEASDRPGGRMATDVIDGFRVDRGFQVLNTGYPAVPRALDLPGLALRAFQPGARVRTESGSHVVSDPRRAPASALSTLRAPIGSAADKARVAAVSAALVARESAARATPDQPALERWRQRGVSSGFVDTFLRPFLSGVLLDADLSTSARFTDLVWRSFARGTIAVPARGMAAVPAQLAGRLASGTVEYGVRVTGIGSGEVETSAGTVACSAVVVAADPVAGAHLLGVPAPEMHGVTTWFHAARSAPVADRLLTLDGSGRTGIANSIVLTNAAPSYSSDGRALVATSVLGVGTTTDRQLRAHLSWLYESDAADWELVAEVAVPDALPAFPPGSPLRRRPQVAPGVFAAGDWRDTPSIQGALVSGRRVADAVLAATPG